MSGRDFVGATIEDCRPSNQGLLRRLFCFLGIHGKRQLCKVGFDLGDGSGSRSYFGRPVPVREMQEDGGLCIVLHAYVCTCCGHQKPVGIWKRMRARERR